MEIRNRVRVYWVLPHWLCTGWAVRCVVSRLCVKSVDALPALGMHTLCTVSQPHLHLIEALDTGGGLLRDTDDVLGHLGPALGVLGQTIADQAQHNLELGVVSGGRVGQGAVLGVCSLGLDTLCVGKIQIRDWKSYATGIIT